MTGYDSWKLEGPPLDETPRPIISCNNGQWIVEYDGETFECSSEEDTKDCIEEIGYVEPDW